MKRDGWDDAFLAGDARDRFLHAQERRVDSVLKELGL
jgi:putative tricarboxylic transport membrane protein